MEQILHAIYTLKHFGNGVRYVYEDKIREAFMQVEPLTNVTGCVRGHWNALRGMF
jgi:hypothetical protein